jgi:hypothetical protein
MFHKRYENIIIYPTLYLKFTYEWQKHTMQSLYRSTIAGLSKYYSKNKKT